MSAFEAPAARPYIEPFDEVDAVRQALAADGDQRPPPRTQIQHR